MELKLVINMKKLITIISILFFSTLSFSQQLNEINYTLSLDTKEIATYGDAVTMFTFQLNSRAGDFDQNFRVLKDIVKTKYDKDKPLRKGNIAYMTARYLKLNDSLMFRITGFERYAYRTCVAHKIMYGDGSENDIMSGSELLEVFSKISEYREGNQ